MRSIKHLLHNISSAFLHELKSIFSDNGAILILIIAVFIYPLIYSIAYKNNVMKNIPVAVVDLDRTTQSRKITEHVNATPQLHIVAKTQSLEEAKQLFWQNKVSGILLIPDGFSKKILRNEQSDLSIYCDASYFLMYKETLSAVMNTVSDYSNQIVIQRLMSKGLSENQAELVQHPLQTQYRSLYNPSGAYGTYVMPGIILLIIQQTLLIGIGYVGGASSEDENSNPNHPRLSKISNITATLFGKSLSYLLISLFNAAFALVMIHSWFGFNNKASLINVLIILLPYLLAVIFLALTISPLFKRREHSIMFMVFLSPIIFFLSGVSWPTSSMPTALVYISQIMPSSHAIPAILKLRNMGISIHSVEPQLIKLLLQTVIFFVTAVLSNIFFSRKRKAV